MSDPTTTVTSATSDGARTDAGQAPTGQDLLWPPAFDAAIFDFDGTIAESGGIWLDVDKDFLARRGLAYTPEFTIELSTLGFAEGAQFVVDRYHLDEDPADICREWNEIGERLYRDRVRLRPGAEAYLRRLRALGVPIALATTNAPGVIDATRAHIDVDGLFDVRVHGIEVARSKHFPDIYEEAARRLGVRVDRCVVFEDIVPGLRAAMSVGALGCGVRSNDPTQDPDALRALADAWVDDWTQVVPR